MNIKIIRDNQILGFKTNISRKGFTLLEILVAVTIFSLVAAGVGGVFISVRKAWLSQKGTVDVVQNSRWAMEFMCNEIRQAGSINTNPGGLPQGQVIRLRPHPGPPTDFVWYWRGDSVSETTPNGYSSCLYRGVGNNINQAYAVRYQLANIIVPNPDLVNNITGFPSPDGIADPIFIENAGLVTIELTLRPRPTQAVGSGNMNYTISSGVRPRN